MADHPRRDSTVITRGVAIKVGAGALAVLAAAAVVVIVLTRGGAGGVARSWFDDPLPGARLALGTVDILAHGADPDGVAAVELTIDDEVVATQEVAGGPALATARFGWTATEPGAAELIVRSRDSGGEWGTAAHITVYFGGPLPSPTGTPTPTTTPEPSPSGEPGPTPGTSAPPPRPTTSAPPPPCTTLVAPGLVSPQAGATVGSVTPVLRWSYGGPCPVNGYALELGTDRDITRILRSTTTGNAVLTWQVTPALIDCQRYYWRVRATLGGTSGPWSTVSSFVVGVGRCPSAG